MRFKLSQEESISLEDIKKDCDLNTDKIYYFLGETKEDNIKKLSTTIEKLKRNIYVKKISFSLENDDFIYSVHIV